jgi:hypothetical protein
MNSSPAAAEQWHAADSRHNVALINLEWALAADARRWAFGADYHFQENLMRSLPVLLFIIIWSGLAAGQQPEGEDSPYIQLLMREAKATSVSEAGSVTLPSKKTLKVFVYAPAQDQVQDSFEGWLAEWNNSGGVKYGHLEAVTDASQADIILARIVSSLTTRVTPREDSDIDNPGVMIDPMTGRTQPHVYRPGARSYYSADVYCYVVARDAGGLKVLWRGKDAVRIYRDTKARGGNFKNLRGARDSKIAGDRLRDKFFEMMRVRTGG